MSLTSILFPHTLNFEEIKMKEDLDALYEGLDYEEWFDPSKVKPSLQRKRMIDTFAIMGVVNIIETMDIFGEDRESSSHRPFYLFIYFNMRYFGICR